MENGEYWCFSDEGNVLWKKNLNNRIVDINAFENYNRAVTEQGKTFIIDNEGNDVFNFESGKEVQYAASEPEIIRLMSGKKGKYFYFLSHNKNQLWKYDIREKINFIDALDDGGLIISIEGKNIFAFRIIWR